MKYKYVIIVFMLKGKNLYMQKTKLFVVATTTLATLGLVTTSSSAQANEVKDGDNTYYVVESGDTLSKISEKYNVSYQVVHANNTNLISNPNLIYVGQKFLVSGKDFKNTNKVAPKQAVTKVEAPKAQVAPVQKQETVTEKATPQTQTPVRTNGVLHTGYSSLAEAHAHRVGIEQGGNYNAYLGLNYNYIGGYGFAKSTWLWLSRLTGTSPTDFSVAHQDQLADKLVEVAFDGDWGNVPRSGGW